MDSICDSAEAIFAWTSASSLALTSAAFFSRSAVAAAICTAMAFSVVSRYAATAA